MAALIYFQTSPIEKFNKYFMLGFNYTKSNGTLAKKEAQLAWVLLFPTVLIIFSIVILPLISIFWISFKPISLSDLRPPKPIVKERL